MTGVASLFYTFTAIMEYFVTRQLRDPYGRRKVRDKIARLDGHIILAGLGRMGRQAAGELAEAGQAFVIVDSTGATEVYAHDHGHLYVIGDATEGELQEAGVGRAAALIAATGDDANNTFIVMSARALNPELFIVARAEDDAALRKLRKAGADRAINPYAIGGRRLVNLVVHPATELFETTMKRGGQALGLQDFEVQALSPFAGKGLRDLELRKRCGVNVLAVIRGGDSLPIPGPDFELQVGDHPISLGTKEQFGRLEGLAYTET